MGSFLRIRNGFTWEKILFDIHWQLADLVGVDLKRDRPPLEERKKEGKKEGGKEGRKERKKEG